MHLTSLWSRVSKCNGHVTVYIPSGCDARLDTWWGRLLFRFGYWIKRDDSE